MANGRYSIKNERACSLCGADVGKLLEDEVLTAPVEVFDHVLAMTDGAPTLKRAVCAHCAEEVAAAHARLGAALRAARAILRSKGRRARHSG